MAKIGRSRSVAVHFLGKVKTACQMAAILLLLYHGIFLGIDTDALGTVLIYVAALLTLWSMGYYLRRTMPWMPGTSRMRATRPLPRMVAPERPGSAW